VGGEEPQGSPLSRFWAANAKVTLLPWHESRAVLSMRDCLDRTAAATRADPDDSQPMETPTNARLASGRYTRPEPVRALAR
jgi:hypothetical protein